MELLDLEDVLSRLDDIVVELVPVRQSSQSRPRDVSERAEPKAMKD